MNGSDPKINTSPLLDIRRRFAPDLERVEARIAEALKTSNPILRQVIDTFLQTKGKQLRPMMTIIAALMFGQVNVAAISAAAAVELLHSASLIHDDVVDNTDTRRRRPTINSLFDNRIAVLAGDFFVSNSLRIAAETLNINITRELGELGKQLSVGEFEQIYTARQHCLDESLYFRTIYSKTASLFVACVRMGGYAVGAKEADIDLISRYATLFGEAFQITDDVFDYFDSAKVGKPTTGHDLREGKITLPLIFALRNAPDDTRSELLDLLDSDSLDDTAIRRLIDFAKDNGGIDYARATVARLRSEADAILRQLPEGDSRKALADLFDFIIDREN